MTKWFDRDDDRWRYERSYGHDRGFDYDRERMGRESDRWRYGRSYGYDRGFDYDRERMDRSLESDRENDRWRYGPSSYNDMYGRPISNDQGRRGTWYSEQAWNRNERWRGPHTGRGPRGYQRSDERIKEDVYDRLTQHGQIDASDIEVDVDNGIVTLKGKINDRWAKRMAEDVADEVFGVRDVYNQIHVEEQGVLGKIADAFS